MAVGQPFQDHWMSERGTYACPCPLPFMKSCLVLLMLRHPQKRLLLGITARQPLIVPVQIGLPPSGRYVGLHTPSICCGQLPSIRRPTVACTPRTVVMERRALPLLCGLLPASFYTTGRNAPSNPRNSFCVSPTSGDSAASRHPATDARTSSSTFCAASGSAASQQHASVGDGAVLFRKPHLGFSVLVREGVDVECG